MRWPVIALAALLLGIVGGFALARLDERSLFVDHPPGPDVPRIHTVTVSPEDDVGRGGAVHGVMGWRYFEIPAGESGPSRNELRFRFTAPAEIRQLDVSVDIGDPRVTLVELAAGINLEGYAFEEEQFSRSDRKSVV